MAASIFKEGKNADWYCLESKDDEPIQISEVIHILTGKTYDYICKTSLKEFCLFPSLKMFII